MKFDESRLKWTREPADCVVSAGKSEITTKPHTDLWQRTYYHFRNDNAPVLQMETEEAYFSLSRCGSAICGRAAEGFPLASTPAAPKNLPSRRYLPIWS